MASTPFKGQFSFINKDAKNIASTDHRNAVAWHVMHRYEPFKRRRRSESRSPAKSSPETSSPTVAGPRLDQHPPMIGRLITFAHEVLIPQIWPDGQNTGLLASWHDLSTDGNYDCHDKAYLALIATILSLTNNLDLDASRLYKEAVTDLKQHNNVSERLFRAILCLFSIQTILGHSDTARSLLKMLHRLIDSGPCKGITSISASLRLDILSCDVFFALRYGTRPLFPAKTWSVGRLTDSWRQRLGPRVDITSLKDFPTILDVMASFHELLAGRRAFKDPGEQLHQWQQVRHLECLSRLADQSVSLSLYPHRFVEPAVHQVLINAALLLAVMHGPCAEPIRIGRLLYGRFTQSLLKLPSETFARRIDLFASVMSLGILSARVFATGADEIDEVANYMKRLKLRLEEGSKTAEPFVDKALQKEVQGEVHVRGSDMVSGLYLACDMSWRGTSSAAMSVYL